VGQEELKEDRFGRFKYGLPPKSNSKAGFWHFVEALWFSFQVKSNGGYMGD